MKLLRNLIISQLTASGMIFDESGIEINKNKERPAHIRFKKWCGLIREDFEKWIQKNRIIIGK